MIVQQNYRKAYIIDNQQILYIFITIHLQLKYTTNKAKYSRLSMRNYCTFDNGAFIAEETPNNNETSAFHILSNINNKKWIVEKQSNGYCIIDLTAIKQKPAYFNEISFYSHNPQQDNLYYINVQFKQKATSEWNALGCFELQLHSGWQSFNLRNYDSGKVKFLKLSMIDNYGGKYIKLTQIGLGCSVQQKSYKQLINGMNELRAENLQLKSAIEKILMDIKKKEQYFENKILILQKNNEKLVEMIQNNENQVSYKCAESVVIQVDNENESNASSQQFYKLNPIFSKEEGDFEVGCEKEQYELL